MSGFGDKLTEKSAQRIQRDEDFQKSDKFLHWKDPIVPRNPKWAGKPLKDTKEGRCAVVLDGGLGYCGAPNGDNAFRFCEFHAGIYLNKAVRLR